MSNTQPELLDEKIAKKAEFRTKEFIASHTVVPGRLEEVPDVIGIMGSNRDGLTALMLLLLSHPGIDRAYFQPYKTLLRYGDTFGQFILNPGDKRIVIKESLGPREQESTYDPIENLHNAGVPLEKQSWIFGSRDPRAAFSSWFKFMPEAQAEMYARCQQHTLDMFQRYQGAVTAIPLTYELFGQYSEQPVFQSLLRKLNLNPLNGNKLEFDRDKVGSRLVLGEASEPSYYQAVIEPTLQRREFMYVHPNGHLPPLHTRDIEMRCRSSYERFHDLAIDHFNLR